METSSVAPYLIGGGLAIAGTVISQFFGLFSGWVERRHQTALRKKQRLENMTDLVSTSLGWFRLLLMCRDIEQYKAAQPPVQVRQIVMLARLSFPSIVEPAKQFARGCIDYYGFVGACFHPATPASFGALMFLAIQNNPALKGRDEQILILRNNLDDAIAEEGKKYQHL